MSLFLVLLALGTTLSGVAVHIVWWRIRRPADDVLALALSLGAAPFALSWMIAWFNSPLFGRGLPFSLSLLVPWVALAILHGLVALVYMSCYTAAQAASPTVLIVLLSANSDQGIEPGQIHEKLTDDLVAGNLVQAAIHEQFITENPKDACLTMAPRGRFLLFLGRTARRLAGLSAPIG